MAELRVIALSEKWGEECQSEAVREILDKEASRSHYAGKCEMHSMRNDPRKYAEIVYLMTVIVEGIGPGGSAQLDQWIQNLRDKLPPEDAKMHEELFLKIEKDEQDRFKGRK